SNPMFPGKGVRDIDAFVRPLGFEAQSRADYARVSDRGRACLEAFAAGINAALHAAHGVYPIEYVALGPVRPWHPADALLCAQAGAFWGQRSRPDWDLAFAAALGHPGETGARQFFPEARGEGAPSGVLPRGGGDNEAERKPPVHLPANGSNNWV